MKNITLRKNMLLFIVLLIWGCGESTEQAHKKTEKKEVAKKEAKDDSKLLDGQASLMIGDQVIEMSQFLKNKTEITFIKDKFAVRLSSPDDDKFITINFSGPDAYDSRPLSFSLAQSKEERYAAIGLIGFTTGGLRDVVRLTKGTLTLEELDEETLDFKVSFEGSAQSITQKDGKTAIEEIEGITGKIDIQFDNKLDVRKNE